MGSHRSRKCGDQQPAQSSPTAAVQYTTTVIQTQSDNIEELKQVVHIKDGNRTIHHKMDRQRDSEMRSER
jgi:hypothetical protein